MARTNQARAVRPVWPVWPGWGDQLRSPLAGAEGSQDPISGGGGSPPPEGAPSLNFSVATNSMYVALFVG